MNDVPYTLDIALVPLIWRVNRPSSFCQDERFETCKQPSTQQVAASRSTRLHFLVLSQRRESSQ